MDADPNFERDDFYPSALSSATAAGGEVYKLPQTLDVHRALQGKNLEQELAQAQALTEQYLACVRAGAQRQVCEQQVDPSSGQ